MKDTKITFNELMKELDKYRGSHTTTINLTDEQKKFILTCRDNPKPVTWIKMSELWTKLGWGKMPPSSMAFRYNKIKNGEL